jgi:adenosylcobinamide kinase/adenosylcobinamide-phosphate guanylyltransferase
MLIFVSGGSASGKSALAEGVCCALPGDHIYIATMPVHGPEDERKVARHHALRAGRGFVRTLEMPGRLGAVPGDATVLFECLSTFTANRMFSGEPEPPEGWEAALWQELSDHLLSRPGHTVIVSAEVGCDGAAFDAYTEAYRAALTGLGRRLAAAADCAVEAVAGRAVVHKGTMPTPQAAPL